MDLFTKKDPTRDEYIIAHSLVMLGMKKIGQEKVDKIVKNDDIKNTLKEFWGNFNQMFIFVNQASADNLQFLTETPSLDKIKRKMIMVVKTRQMKSEEFLDANISKDIMMMEMNRSILENLFLVCQEVFMPVLGNPHNLIGLSDLVSKDLMDKFHNFMAHTYVTLGQVKGRTLLPLPPADVTSSEKTSSKDKAHILEGAIITWTKQIKNVLK